MKHVALLGVSLAAVVAAATTHGAAAPGGTIVLAANRAPLWTGEVYRVGASGRRVNLSRSPARDVDPAVSTSGSRVAFASARGGRAALYTVGTSGRGLRRVSPYLFPVGPGDALSAQIAWSPDDRAIVAAVGGSAPYDPSVYLARPGQSWRLLARQAAAPAWSPDGRLFSYVLPASGTVRVAAPTGKTVWSTAGVAAAWSGQGRLAVQQNSYTVDVFDEVGKQWASLDAVAFAWSPNGDRLATVTEHGRVQVRATSALGRPSVDVPWRGAQSVSFLGATKLRITAQSGTRGYDLVRRRAFTLPRVYTVWNSVVYADGSEAVATTFSPTGQALTLARAGGGSAVLASAPPCGDELDFDSVAFVPGGKQVVYEAACPEPSADVYSVSPDGSGLHRLTTDTADDTQPALSPDGGTVAYVQKANAVHCGGCPETIHVMRSDGTGDRPLPNAPDAADTPYDDWPAFSPDGARLLFVRSGANDLSLAVEPVAGGAVKLLGFWGTTPAWGPQRIAYQSAAPAVSTAAPDGSDRRPVTVAGKAVAGIPAWSPAGRLALLQRHGASLSILLPDSGRRIPLPLRWEAPGVGLAWSPDGTRLAVVGADADGVGDVWTIGADGRGLGRVTHDLGAVGGVGWR